MIDITPSCRYVKLVCPNGPSPLVYDISNGPEYLVGQVVSKGSSHRGCIVLHASPPPHCMVTPGTTIRYSEQLTYKVEELEYNVVVRLGSGGDEEIYVYPKRVWDKVWRLVLNPFLDNKPMRQQGAIFYGPPGTGKTSMATVMASIAGLEVVKASPDMVLSKWMGETEKKITYVLALAEKVEPSMLLLDDAEWAARRRRDIAESGGTAALAYAGLLNKLLEYIEKWWKEKRRVLAVITTNYHENLLDEALRRGGRLGKPIYIPLPDVEAVKTYLVLRGVPEEQAEELAIKVVNAGLPMSDVAHIVYQVLAGEEPMIEPVSGAGYKRYVPPRLGSRVVEVVKTLGEKYRLKRHGKRIVLHIYGPEPVAIPVAVVLSAIHMKTPSVILTDPRKIDDAIDTAEATDGFIIVPSETTPPEIQTMIYTRATKIILAGKKRPDGIYAATIPLTKPVGVPLPEYSKALAEIVYNFYNIEYEPRDIEAAARMRLERLLEQLSIAAVYGSNASDILRFMENW